MGFVGDLFGGGGSNSGLRWKAKEAPILSPTDLTQTTGAYNQAQSGLAQQQAFVNALKAQNGLGNQSSVFNQLQNVASGKGPNPAQAMLNQQTGNNVASQAALAAGQRGAGSNVGLMARQIGQQGAGIQQNAIGQGATMQANQSLGALGQMGGIAGQQVGNQANAIQGANQANIAEQAQLLNAINQINQNKVAMQSNVNNANAGIQGMVGQGQSSILGGVMSGVGSAFGLANGGMAGYDGGGLVNLSDVNLSSQAFQPSSYAGSLLPPNAIQSPQPTNAANFLAGYSQPQQDQQSQPQNQSAPQNSNDSLFKGMSSMSGGGIKKLFGMSNGGMSYKQGGNVPGKAQVAGDSPVNDTVEAKLSPGEIVIPRSIVNHPDAARLAAEFVQEQLEKHGKAKQNFDVGGTAIESPQAMAQNQNQFSQPQILAPNEAPQRAPQQEQSDSDPYGLNTQYNMASAGINKQLGALQGGVAGAQGLSREEQAAYVNQAAEQKQQNDLYQKNLDQLQSARDQARAAYQNTNVDPNRYLSNMGTGKKISTALGLILGGMGGALTHSGNPVLEFLNKQISNDIEAQKAELGKRDNLLSSNLQDFGNLNHAAEMTRMQINDQVANHLGMAAAKYKGSQAGANAQMAQGQLLAQNAQIMGQLAAEKAAMDQARGMAGAGGNFNVPAGMDPAEDRRIEINGQVFHTSDKETANKVKPQLQALDALESAVSRVEEFNKEKGRTSSLIPTENRGKSEGLNREIEAAIAKVEASGGQIGRLVDKFKEMAPEAGAWRQSLDTGKANSLKEFIASERLALKRNNLNSGIVLKKSGK